ncbi:Lrp/AsnC family transcriptional regulator [Pontimicrobium sp. SW4]|uniref:Lrp/AsnC family transcriptional regulator n=1 Tax=Pontimicrobium sp. SW4 TaxID=3153519 RepID=A0AAU7BPE5_9FLAO
MVDKTDYRIIEELNKNARVSFADIGRQIHLSASSVRERIQKLEDLGIIKGYKLELDNSKLGLGMEVFIMLKLFSGKLKIFISDINSFSEIKESYRVTGSHNIHMKVVLKNQMHLQQFIDKLINYGDPTTHLILSELGKD